MRPDRYRDAAPVPKFATSREDDDRPNGRKSFMANVSSSGLAAPLPGARTGIITSLINQARSAFAARRAAAAEIRALAEVLALTCPADRRRLLAEYDIAVTRQTLRGNAR